MTEITDKKLSCCCDNRSYCMYLVSFSSKLYACDRNEWYKKFKLLGYRPIIISGSISHRIRCLNLLSSTIAYCSDVWIQTG